MRKTAFLLAISLVSALPALAQTEFGVLYGGSKRVVNTNNEAAPGTTLRNPGFSFSNSAVDIYYAVQIDPGTMFKLQAGRIDSPIAFREAGPDNTTVRRDVEGQVQHVEGVVEYRFSEPYGSTGLFAGIGLYRHSASGFASTTDFGLPIGVTADFPMTRRFGFIVAATYHLTNADFRPRYLTVGGGLRLAF
ncbi:MAG TPA: hypothetical protein VLU46_10000 [Thermoanaerobaculia bacterium]|nr:hypothetical protein [Thermoanaerobaculia bacterium]